MPQEIERKFLVTGDQWRTLAQPQLYCQGYIPTQGKQTIRIRRVGERGYLTIKGPSTGLTRSEFEYEIPAGEAQTMLDSLCQPPVIQKYRYRIAIKELVWEVDEFLRENAGLIVAEVEVPREDYPVPIPDWIGAEVSGDARYYNSNLAQHPYSEWSS